MFSTWGLFPPSLTQKQQIKSVEFNWNRENNLCFYYKRKRSKTKNLRVHLRMIRNVEQNWAEEKKEVREGRGEEGRKKVGYNRFEVQRLVHLTEFHLLICWLFSLEGFSWSPGSLHVEYLGIVSWTFWILHDETRDTESCNNPLEHIDLWWWFQKAVN